MSASYDSIFLSNNGTNIFTTLGFLSRIKKMTERTKFWNVAGCGSLIIFLRLIGHSYSQIMKILSNFDLISTMINGSSLIPENEDNKKDYIKKWLIDHLEDSDFFSPKINLEEISKETNLFPNFILYSRSDQKIVQINPHNFPRVKLIDCVLASLCYVGVYEEYSFGEKVYSNLSSIDCFPCFYIFRDVHLADSKVDKEEGHSVGKCLIIGNIGKFDESSKSQKLGPLSKVESKIIRQYSEHEKYKIENIFANFDTEEAVKIHSFYKRGKLGSEEINTLFELGEEQGTSFEKEKDPEVGRKHFIEEVEGQS
jgi:hypothetical protein